LVVVYNGITVTSVDAVVKVYKIQNVQLLFNIDERQFMLSFLFF